MKRRINNIAQFIGLLLLGGQGVVSCTSKAQEVEVKEVIALRASELYKGKSVFQFLKQHQGEYQEIAKQYVKLAEENKESNPTKASYYLKRAISLTPKLDLYQKLGHHLISTKNYTEAEEVYDLLTREQYIQKGEEAGQDDFYFLGEPDDETRFTAFKVQLLANPQATFYTLMDYIQVNEIENKTELKVRLLEDKDMVSDTSSLAYKSIAKSFARLESNNGEHNFSTLVRWIEDTSASFEITKSTIANFHYTSDYYGEEDIESEEDINHYVKFLQENENKEEDELQWYDLNYNRLVKLPNSIYAIEYSIDTSETACPKEMRHIYHRLVTYTEGGKIIDSKIVAWQSGEQLATLIFKAPHFTITESKRVWKRPYVKDDFDNYLLKTEEVGTKSYSISPTGKIVESPL